MDGFQIFMPQKADNKDLKIVRIISPSIRAKTPRPINPEIIASIAAPTADIKSIIANALKCNSFCRSD